MSIAQHAETHAATAFRRGVRHSSERGPARLQQPASRWLCELLAPLGVRRRIAAQESLFAPDDPARHYYLIEGGRLLVHRRPQRQPTVVRIVRDASLMIYDCGGLHAAHCHAVEPTTVLAIDRRRLELRAMLEPALAGVLRQVHASELGFILRSLGVVDGAHQGHSLGQDIALDRQSRLLRRLSAGANTIPIRATGWRQLPSTAA